MQKVVDYSTLSEDSLMRFFVEGAKFDGISIQAGTHKVGNKNFDALRLIEKEIAIRDPLMVRTLLGDDNLSVRKWAASFLLHFVPEEAQKVLEDISAGPPSFVRLSAKGILERWHEGVLKHPSE